MNLSILVLKIMAIAFWVLMDRITGDAKGMHKELKEKYTLYK